MTVNIARVEDRLVVVSQPTDVAVYDFDFELGFHCSHPHVFEREERCVLRIGAIADYAQRFENMLGWGLRLVNAPAEHERASELEHWYPVLHDLTPRTEVFDTLPSVEQVEARFAWPVFLKGSRQTSKHNASLSVIGNAAQYRHAAELWTKDPVLHWQKPVVREFVQLHPVQGGIPGKVRPSMEYRSFWWQGACVGWGRYWYMVPPYDCPDAADGLAVAQEAASRLNVPFLVVDVAKTADGRWIVIECNDAQEAGYASIAPRALWHAILFGEASSSAAGAAA